MLFIRRAYFLGLFFLFFIFSSFYQFDLESSKYNYFVFEDSSGKIWISSEEGWTKFNGERKINYWANETDGFEGQYIQSNIFEDSSQNLYFTTYEYLIQYNPKLNVFKSFQLFEDENVEYSIVAINASNNQLYLTVNRMLVIYDFRIQKIIKIINDDVKSKRFAISSDYKFIVGCPWINDEGIEIFKFENGDWVKRELVENVKIPGLDLESKIQNAIIDGNIIWSLGKNFIYKIDRQKNIILEKFDFDSDTNFNDFILYSNYLIIATKNEGLLKFDKNSGLLLSPQLFKKFSGKSISRINLLSDDKLMLSFPNEGVQSVDLEMLSDRIDEIDGPLQFIDHRDKNIIGVSKNGTFFLLDSLNNVLSKKSLSNLTSNSIIDITYDNENGAVYFMTRSSVFQLIDDSTDFERLSSYADRQLYSFGKCDGKITINSSSGVWDLNKDTTSSIAQFKCNNSEVIYSYGNEEGSQFWTCSNNTFYYKTKKETFKFDCSGFINDIYYNDELVIISNSIGVDLFKRKEQEYIHSVFSNCEFNNKQFFGCTKSKNGYYIFTSEEGLIVSDEHFNNYFIEEIEFDLDNKAPFTSNGFDVYFSSLSGVHLLDESKFKDIKKKNILHIESILVDGQKYSNLKANFIDTINIDYSKKNIQLEIDIANFESSSNNYIGYKYDGIDSQWRCNSTLQPLDLPVFKYGKFQLVIQYFNGSYLIDEKKNDYQYLPTIPPNLVVSIFSRTHIYRNRLWN